MRKEAEIEAALAAAMPEGVTAWAPGQSAASRYSSSTPGGMLTAGILGRKAKKAGEDDTVEVPRFAVVAVSDTRVCLFS